MSDERTINDGDMLDCGDIYVRPTSGIGTGYTRTQDGRVICYAHSDESERADFAKADRFTAYVSSDGNSLTTWPGGYLAEVTSWTESKTGWAGSTIYAYRFLAPNGARFYGRNGGAGMVITVKRAKS